jgi:hypothetical protein
MDYSNYSYDSILDSLKALHISHILLLHMGETPVGGPSAIVRPFTTKLDIAGLQTVIQRLKSKKRTSDSTMYLDGGFTAETEMTDCVQRESGDGYRYFMVGRFFPSPQRIDLFPRLGPAPGIELESVGVPYLFVAQSPLPYAGLVATSVVDIYDDNVEQKPYDFNDLWRSWAIMVELKREPCFKAWLESGAISSIVRECLDTRALAPCKVLAEKLGDVNELRAKE